MTKKLQKFLFLGLLLLGLGGAANLDAQNRQRVTDRQLRVLLARIETKTDAFKQVANRSLDQSRINNTTSEDVINGFITDFENATDELNRGFNARRNVSSEASEVLSRATVIDQYVRNNQLSAGAERQWNSLRTDLNTLAGYYRLAWNWNQQLPSNNSNYPANNGGYPSNNSTYPVYTVSDSQIRGLITRIESKTDTFKRQLDSSLDRSRWNNTNSEDNLSAFVSEFENATDRLKQKFDNRNSVGNDVSDVLTRAAYIDRFMARNNLSRAAESQWTSLRTDLNMLATYYRVSWNWNQTLPPFETGFPNTSTGGNTTGARFDSRLTGTYRLNTSQSDDVAAVIDRSLGYYTTGQRDNVRRNLERRLRSPEIIAIDKNGPSVTLASSNAPQLTFEADGIAKTESNNRGRTITTTASADRQDGFTINYTGDRSNDFFVSFMPTRDGQLKVTRRIYLENRSDQITVSSVYDKTDNVAQWPPVNSGTNWNPGTTAGSGNFAIPNGTQLTAVLRNGITTRDSQVNDKFTMEVTSPSEYRGAIIEGRIVKADNSGRVSGRANISLDFDTIQMPGGQSYRFAGIIDGATAANGDNITVNNEGTVRDSNQTTKTVTRAGIGAVLGALIGAIAGGGEGAAVGAAVGAGAGAGTVLIQGRDDIELGQGSTFRITATAPGNTGSVRQ